MEKVENKTPLVIECESCGFETSVFFDKKKVGMTHICPECGDTIISQRKNHIVNILILSFSGIILFFPTILAPFIKVNMGQLSNHTSLIECILSIHQKGLLITFVIAFITTIIIPALFLLSMFSLSFLILKKRGLKIIKLLTTILSKIKDWYMIDVFLIAVFVSIIKLKDMFMLDFHFGLVFIILEVTIINVLLTLFDKNVFWVDGTGVLPIEQRLHDKYALKLSLIFNLTALILYVPANVYPVMTVTSLGNSTTSTIIDGIIIFFRDEMYLVGTIILTASIIIPLIKITAIFLFIIYGRRLKKINKKNKIKTYHFIEFIGKWSMIDIFVITILAGVVNIGHMAKIEGESGASFFIMVVVFTMIAAKVFPSRSFR